MKILVWLNDPWYETHKETGETRVQVYPYTLGSAAPFYRLHLPHFALQEHGLADVDFYRGTTPPSVKGYDLFVTDRAWDGQEDLLDELQREQVRFVFDVGDNIFALHPQTGKPFTKDKTREKLLTLINAADRVTVTTPGVARSLSGLNTKVFPNYLDLNLFPVKEQENQPLRIGWAGGNTHLEDLLGVALILNALVDKYGIDFIVFGFNELPDGLLKARHEMSVTFDKYFTRLAELNFDIVIAPLSDDDFSTCRSDLRIREAAALGIPVVAQNRGAYRNLRHKQEGFLADSLMDWYHYLSLLIENPEIRLNMGRQGRKRAEAEYNAFSRDVALERYTFYQALLQDRAA